MHDALLLVDVFDDFEHEDGDVLRESFRATLSVLLELIEAARDARVPVIYANDRHGRWHGDPRRFLAELDLAAGDGMAAGLIPEPDDPFFFKDRYSAFGHTALDVLLAELGTDRLLLAGMSLEGCVTQTAIDARERGLLVTVVEPACARIDEKGAEVAVDYLRRVVGARVVGGVESCWRESPASAAESRSERALSRRSPARRARRASQRASPPGP
jgi:nicotinamidase-related amidase